MRKFLGLAAIVVAFVALAPLAYAQTDTSVRDPFVPLVQPSPLASGTDPTVPTDPTNPVEPVPPPVEPMPQTGSSTATWVGFGYVLVALGTGSVALARVLGPQRRPAVR